jgi:transcriptional regulator with XRE-family HTH domain
MSHGGIAWCDVLRLDLPGRSIRITSGTFRFVRGEGGFGMSPVDSAGEPALVRRQLGRHLRRLRLAVGKTHADAETAGMGHRSTLWRIEAGRAKVRPSTVRALCWLYDADDATSDALYAMARQAEQPGWWEEYRDDLPTWFTLYVELEAAARRISAFHPTFVDGLLQTPEYARAVFIAGYPAPSPGDVERQVAIRLERQRRAFERTQPLQLSVVLSEAVLCQEVGGPEAMAAQLDHLRSLNGGGAVEIRALPFTAGAHPAMKGRFTVLDLDGDVDPDVVYLETLNGGRYLEQRSELDRFRGIFSELRDLAVPLEELP